jgi:hypothetical protein
VCEATAKARATEGFVRARRGAEVLQLPEPLMNLAEIVSGALRVREVCSDFWPGLVYSGPSPSFLPSKIYISSHWYDKRGVFKLMMMRALLSPRSLS